jgi:predicted MFS family arabinose efflux permease
MPGDDADNAERADRATRNAAGTLALVIPGDTLLYLLLPLYAPVFAITLPEAGLLLSANRLIRIVAYRIVARFYAARGARTACLLAALAGLAATLLYAVCSGLWALLAGRLLWGLSFATLNIANQALSTSVAAGAARRSGRARTIIASGSMTALVAGAILAEWQGPRAALWAAAAAALLAPLLALRLPTTPEPMAHSRDASVTFPGAMSSWSFCFGFVLDGLFVFGLSLLAKASFTTGAVIAAGAVMALRYLSEMALSAASGRLAEQVGARRLLVGLTLAIAAVLVLLATSGPLLWAAVLAVVLLRALVQPLPPPVIAARHPGAGRVPAMARQAVWRDIGAGTGPLAAGLLFASAPTIAIWAGASLLLVAAGLRLARERGAGR